MQAVQSHIQGKHGAQASAVAIPGAHAKGQLALFKLAAGRPHLGPSLCQRLHRSCRCSSSSTADPSPGTAASGRPLKRCRAQEFLVRSHEEQRAFVEKKRRQKAEAIRAEEEAQRARLFVRGVCFEATVNDIRDYFEGLCSGLGLGSNNVIGVRKLKNFQKNGAVEVALRTPQVAQAILDKCTASARGAPMSRELHYHVAMAYSPTWQRVHYRTRGLLSLYRPLLVSKSKGGGRAQQGAAGHFVSLDLQQVAVGCLLSAQQSGSDGQCVVVEHRLTGSGCRSMQLHLDLSSRTLRLRLNSPYTSQQLGGTCPCDLPAACFKVEARFKHVHGTLVAAPDSGLMFTLLHPPCTFKGVRKLDSWSTSWTLDGDDDDDYTWHRMPDFSSNGTWGRCLTYHLQLDHHAINKLSEPALSNRLVTLRLLPREAGWGSLWSMALPPVQLEVKTEHEVRSALSWLDRQLSSLPAPVAWHLECVLGCGALHMWHVIRSMDVEGPADNLIAVLRGTSAASAVKALCVLLGSGEKPMSNPPGRLIRDWLEELVDLGDAAGGPEQAGMAQVPRVLVTPTRVRLQRPDREVDNRVIRAFSQGHPDLNEWTMVRVQLGDENGERLFGGTGPAVFDSLKTWLQQDQRLAGRTYQFLVYSSSQLKEQSCWMVERSEKTTAAMRARAEQLLRGHAGQADMLRQVQVAPTPMHVVHAWLGDFSRIKVPAKAAARMGQALSTTQRTVTIANGEECEIRDLERNNYCFTDGAGQISGELLTSVLDVLNQGRRGKAALTVDNTSAIQVRYGGAKGVLSHNPLLPGRRLLLRPSQIKFPAPHHRALEVCNTASNIPYYLNRQLILLLSNAGVPDEVLLGKQQEMIRKLDAMLSQGAVAVDLLPKLGGINCLGLLLDMLECGIRPDAEPFLSECLRAVRRQALALLRHKARILVPPTLGATLIGSPDETELLGIDQVFFQVLQRLFCYDSGLPQVLQAEGWRVITGPVLVTKHPVVHPGDVRLLTAVDLPGLRHHVNELVFSVQGYRPLPNQMSGSDLDGDLYAITWDPSLFPTRENYPPQDYAGAKATEKDVVRIPEDLIEHAINHAMNDNLGIICKWWEAHADTAIMGMSDIIYDGKCQELARLASVAVDFPKSGVPAQLDVEGLRPREVPHWHEDKHKKSYHSTTVVGRLYDAVVQEHVKARREDRVVLRDLRAALLEDKGGSGYDSDDDADEQLVWPDHLDAALRVEGVGRGCVWRDWVGLADQLQGEYEVEMMGLLNRWGLEDEGELVTGCVHKFNKLARRGQHDARLAVQAEVAAVTGALRHRLYSAVYAHRTGHDATPEVAPAAPVPGSSIIAPEVASASGGMTTAPDAACAVPGGMRQLMELVGRDAPDMAAAASALYCVAYRGQGILRGLPWVAAGDVLARLRSKAPAVSGCSGSTGRAEEKVAVGGGLRGWLRGTRWLR